MFVTGAPMWTFVSYSNQLPALVVKVARDEAIQAKLAEAVAGFTARFDEALDRVNALK